MTTLGAPVKKNNKKKNKKKGKGGGGGAKPPVATPAAETSVVEKPGDQVADAAVTEAAPANATEGGTTLGGGGGTTLGGGGGGGGGAAAKKKAKKKKKKPAAKPKVEEKKPKVNKRAAAAARIREQVLAQQAADKAAEEEEARQAAEDAAAEAALLEEEKRIAEERLRKKQERDERRKLRAIEEAKRKEEEALQARLAKYGADVDQPVRIDNREKKRREAERKAAAKRKKEEQEEGAQAAKEAAEKKAAEEAAAAAAEAAKGPLVEDWAEGDWDDIEIDLEDSAEEEEEAQDGEGQDTEGNPKKPASKSSAKAAPEEEEEEEAIPEAEVVELESTLRSPIICVLGHVDVGKTKLLDYMRKTHVQDGEAGGITQQIGASFFPIESVETAIRKIAARKKLQFDVPGLLVIDTPGHEAFANLRNRGSGLCDFAILVVDLMAGLEQQTIESINLLKLRKTPFVIALNKLDRVYGWKTVEAGSSAQNYKKQSKNVQQEFQTLVNRVLLQMAEQGLNVSLYWNNKDLKGTINMIPTSAHSGEGVPDLLMVITQVTQKFLSGRVEYHEETQATVLEVKPVQGLGTTIDVILVNGILRRGDRIVLAGLNGPIVTTIKSLLTPQPMKELRVRTPYVQHQAIRAAQGLKVLAPGHDLEKAVPGSPLYVVHNQEEEDDACDDVEEEFEKMRGTLSRDGTGVYVQSSTLGALEALLHFLAQSQIPVVDFAIGEVGKTDVMKAGAMHARKKPEFACILAFDVHISEDAAREARRANVRIFEADIIYHLQEAFTAYLEEMEEAKRTAAAQDAVFPCVLEILDEHIYNNKAPIIIGVRVLEGTLHLNTPLVVQDKNMLNLGRIVSIKLNDVEKQKVPEGSEVSVSIEGPNNYCYGRHFDASNHLTSKISRRSIDAIKSFFSKEFTRDQAVLLAKLKKKQGVV